MSHYEVEFHSIGNANDFRDAVARMGMHPSQGERVKQHGYVVFVNIKGQRRNQEVLELARRYNGTAYSANPAKMSTGRTVALVAVGAAILGGIGYYLYTRNQPTTVAATTPALPVAPTYSAPAPVAASTPTAQQQATNLAEEEATSSFESSIPD
jgi:hypothetical protein